VLRPPSKVRPPVPSCHDAVGGAAVTVWDLCTAAGRYWVLTLVGLTLTLGAGLWVRALPSVYWAQLDVLVLAPEADEFQNTLRLQPMSAIMLAGVVQRDVAGPPGGGMVVSDDVTIVGQGVEHGSWVRLANSGGQWANNFDRPVLDVQAVASTPQEVRRLVDDMVGTIDEALRARQAQAGVAPALRFTTLTSPSGLVVRHGTGQRGLAVATTSFLGLGFTVSVVAYLGARDRRRHLGSTRSASQPGRHGTV